MPRHSRSRCRCCASRCRIASATASRRATWHRAPICRTPCPPSSFLAGGQRIDAEMGFVDPGANAVGFEIDACLPARGGGIACANDAARADGRQACGSDLTCCPSAVVLAPMAGVTDRPFRILCRAFGAGLAASEMITADARLWTTSKSRHRMNHAGEPEPRVVQLAGAEPAALAAAARANVALGAQIIDLNMGCPAKKVCGRLCGSALLTDEPLVARILEAVVQRGRRAGDAEDPHRLGPRAPQWRDRSMHCRELRGRSARRARTHARGFLRRRGRVPDHSRHQIARAHSGVCQWRHRYAAKSARGT